MLLVDRFASSEDYDRAGVEVFVTEEIQLTP
jgi:hypothetical protein